MIAVEDARRESGEGVREAVSFPIPEGRTVEALGAGGALLPSHYYYLLVNAKWYLLYILLSRPGGVYYWKPHQPHHTGGAEQI